MHLGLAFAFGALGLDLALGLDDLGLRAAAADFNIWLALVGGIRVKNQRPLSRRILHT